MTRTSIFFYPYFISALISATTLPACGLYDEATDETTSDDELAARQDELLGDIHYGSECTADERVFLCSAL